MLRQYVRLSACTIFLSLALSAAHADTHKHHSKPDATPSVVVNASDSPSYQPLTAADRDEVRQLEQRSSISDIFSGITGIILFIIGAVSYFVPAVVASKRRCKAFSGIVILNVFLGWTFLGWVVALIWAAIGEQDEAPEIEAASLSLLQ